MSPRKRALVALLALVTIVAAAAFARAYVRGTRIEPERTSPDGLAPGEVESHLVERDGRPWIQVSAVIDAPIAEVWKVVHDHERMTEFMPRMSKLHVVEQQPDGRRRVRIDFLFHWLDRYTEIDVTREVTPARRIERWERTGGTLPVNHGRWVLEPAGKERTFARYEVEAYTGLPTPEWLERAILLDALPVVLKHVGKRIAALRATEPAYLKGAE